MIELSEMIKKTKEDINLFVFDNLPFNLHLMRDINKIWGILEQNV